MSEGEIVQFRFFKPGAWAVSELDPKQPIIEVKVPLEEHPLPLLRARQLEKLGRGEIVEDLPEPEAGDESEGGEGEAGDESEGGEGEAEVSGEAGDKSEGDESKPKAEGEVENTGRRFGRGRKRK